MNSSVTRSFREEFARLPKQIQQQARKNYRLWRRNPRHPSLHFKKVGKFWSVRIDQNFRAIGGLKGDTMYWFHVAPHDEYKRVIKG